MFQTRMELSWLKDNRHLFEGSEWVNVYGSSYIEGDLWSCLSQLHKEGENVNNRVIWYNGKPAGLMLISTIRRSNKRKSEVAEKYHLCVNHEPRVIYLAYTHLEVVRFLLASQKGDYDAFYADLTETQLERYLSISMVRKRLNIEVVSDQPSKMKWVRIDIKKDDIRSRVIRSLKEDSRAESYRHIQIGEDTDEWRPEEVTKHAVLIEKMYLRLVKQRMEMSGPFWKLKLRHIQKLRVEDLDQLKKSWTERGFKTVSRRYELDRAKEGEQLVFFDTDHAVRGKKQLVSIHYIRTVTLDHKYNDGKIPYYRHILKRHIFDYYNKDKTCVLVEIIGVHGESIWSQSFSEGKLIPMDESNFILKGGVRRLLAKVTRYHHEQAIQGWIDQDFNSTFSRVDKHSLRRREAGRAEVCWVRDTLKWMSRRVPFSEVELLYQRRFQGLIQEYAKIRDSNGWSQNLPTKVGVEQEKALERLDEIGRILHDSALPYQQVYRGKLDLYCTPTVLKRVLRLSTKEFDLVVSSILDVSSYHNMTAKQIRRTLYHFPKEAKDFLKVFKDWYEEVKTQELKGRDKREREKYRQQIKNMNLDNLNQLNEFLEAMRRYDPMLSLKRVLKLFSPKEFGNMVTARKEGVFKAQSFTPSYKGMGEWIQSLLRGGAASDFNPKRLYAHLRKELPVDQIVAGQFTKEQGLSILNLVKQQGVPVKEWELLLRLTAKVEQKCSPQFLMAGNASVCCMSFGASNAMTYAEEEAFGVLNFYAEDRVFANSVIWLDEVSGERVLVLDNIEVHPNYKKYKSYLINFFHEITEDLMNLYQVAIVVQGTGFNDLVLYDNKSIKGTFEDYNVVGASPFLNQNGFYSDADTFRIIKGEISLPKPEASVKLNIHKEEFIWVPVKPKKHPSCFE